MSEVRQVARIVVGVDRSACAQLALKWAAYLARRTGATIEAVAVWEPPPSYGRDWSDYFSRREMYADTSRVLDEVIADALGATRPDQLTTVVREGNPADILIAHSANATMLVVGSRGHGGFARLLLGSVSTACAEHAQCPVLVVHGDEPPADGT